jgi:N-acetyl-gamma-glutamyl-phosphate reductase
MATNRIRIGILGATGFTGAELVGLLLKHPQAEIVWLGSEGQSGADYGLVYPQFRHRLPVTLRTLIAAEAALAIPTDVVFSCLPHAASAKAILPFLANGHTRVIDLSADFRLSDPAVYAKTYDHAHPDTELLKQAVYGLTEFSREALKKARLVANPGCYPTSIQLALIPLLRAGIISPANIIADSKSGVSGMGRKATDASHYIACNESFSAYKVGDTHRHLPEIVEQLARAAGPAKASLDVLFTPHLVPMERGILSTVYVDLAPGKTGEEAKAALEAAYAQEPFVVVRADLPRTAEVSRTNECHIHVYAPKSGRKLILVSVIDNMVKGASGQALQNMNAMFGLDETLGLR